jgi:hypothetical protein
MEMMFEANLARIRAHRNNIHRYRRLLRTKLSDLEREFIEKRMADEQTALDALVAETFPIPPSKGFGFFVKYGSGLMSNIRDLLIDGSEKVIAHYRLLLASANTEKERELYRSRIERERRLLDELCKSFPDRIAA